MPKTRTQAGATARRRPTATGAGTNLPEHRWTPALIREGWVPVSRTFLRNYSKLEPRLVVGEAMLVIHLMDFKRDQRAPYPSYKRLAGYMGISDKMVRVHARNLEVKGYLRRLVRQGLPNLFDLSPLLTKLEAFVPAPDTGA